MSVNQQITLYLPHPKAGRMKLQIPFAMKNERESFKKLNGTFYHKQQKLWSIVNSAENIEILKNLFGDKLLCQPYNARPQLPHTECDEKN